VNREDLVVLCFFHKFCEAAESAGCEVHRFDTIAGFNTGVGLIMADTALATAHNGTRIHDPEPDGYPATLRCHDPNGEIYMVTSPGTRLASRPTRTTRFSERSGPAQTRSPPSREVMAMAMENELIITGAFPGAGLLAFVIIPGLLVIWDRVLDHMEW